MILILNVVVRVGWSLSIDESREMEGEKEKEKEESHCGESRPRGRSKGDRRIF